MNLVYLLGGAVIATLLNKKKDAPKSDSEWETLANTAQGQVSELESEAASLRSFVEEIQNELTSNNALNAELISQLQAMLEEANLDIDTLTADLSSAIDADAATPYSQAQYSSLEGLLSEAQNIKQVAEDALAESVAVNNTLNQQVDILSAQVNTKQSELDAAIAQDALTPFGQIDIDIMSELHAAELNQKDDDFNALSTTTTYTINNLNSDIAALETAVSQKNVEIDELVSTGSQNTILIQQLQNDSSALQTALDGKQIELNNAIAADALTPFGQADIDSIELLYEGQINQKETEISGLEEDLGSSQAAYSQSQQDLTELQGELMATLLDVEGLEIDLSNKDSQINALNITLTNAQNSLSLANIDLQAAQLELTQRSAELEEAVNDFSVLDSQYDALVLDVQELQAEVNEIESERVELESEVDNLNNLLYAYQDAEILSSSSSSNKS